MPEPQTIPFAAWEPDRSDRFNPTAEAKGVYSSGGQYAPFPDIQQYGGDSEVDAFTKLLLHMDGADAATSFPDDSPSPKTFTAAGNAQVDTAQSVFGGASLLCDGTGDWISTPDHADFTLGTGPWTIEFRPRPAADGTALRPAGQGPAGLAAATTPWYFERLTTNKLRAHVSNGSAFTTLDTTSDVIAGAFYQIALVRDGNTLRLHFNGAIEATAAFSGTIPDATTALRIGAAGEETGNPWNGWIDEFRLSVGVARWTAAFTPPTSAYSFGAGAEHVVLGARTVYDSATAPAIFFGDDARLYRMVSREAADVSKAGGYSVSAWQGAQFGNNVVFVANGTAPQHYELGVSVDFANLAGSPPTNATSVARVGDFLMMGKGFTAHWSQFNNVTGSWAPDPATQAGNQELDQEQGEIISLIGLDYAAIFQERAIRRAIYVGPPLIFDFGQDYVEKARGCIARNAAAPFGRIIFYAADDGFYAFDGQASTSIGFGKIDDYFVRNLNYAYRHKVCVGIDGLRKLAVFGFPAGSNQFISELLIYSIVDGRWTHDNIDLEFLFDTPSEPLTVETIGAALDPTGNLDSGNINPSSIDSPVFDDRRKRLAGFTRSNHRLNLFSGQPRLATLETAEQELAAGRRSLVTEIWPIGDMQQGNVSASIGYRNLPGASVQFTNATNMNRAGFCPQRKDARFMRGRLMLAAGASWRRMEGIHATAVATGGR